MAQCKGISFISQCRKKKIRLGGLSSSVGNSKYTRKSPLEFRRWAQHTWKIVMKIFSDQQQGIEEANTFRIRDGMIRFHPGARDAHEKESEAREQSLTQPHPFFQSKAGPGGEALGTAGTLALSGGHDSCGTKIEGLVGSA